MTENLPKDIRSQRLTASLLARQKKEQPVHSWSVDVPSELNDWEQGYQTVGQFMSSDLFTVQPDDLIDLAASVMDWRHIRHVPVEDTDGRLVGLVTHRCLLRLLSRGRNPENKLTTVRDIMVENPVTVSPSTSSLDAIELMRTKRVGCLPVVESNELVGIVTSYDFLEASAKLFQQHLTLPQDGGKSRVKSAQA